MKHFFFMVVFLMTCLLQQAVAQDKSVSGRVTDGTNGSGVPGVTVLAKGTKVGTATNSDGQFTLSVPAATTTLQFSSIGYKTTERDITSTATVDVALAVEVRSLDEVVVTGLGTSVARSNSANNVASISAAELVGNTRPATVDAAMYGKLSGAVITQNSGAPGGGLSVQLRGPSSISNSTEPLYIIDGVYANNSSYDSGRGASAFTAAGGSRQDGATNRMSDINPDDIETIEVLKGSSAAAIYGTRANNGVIIITTKRGKTGRTQVGFRQDVGVTTILRRLGQEDWTADKIRNFGRLRGTGTVAGEIARLNAAQAAGQIYDYEDEIFGNTGFLSNTNLNVSGGSEKVRYYISGSNADEGSIVKNLGFRRSSVRANINSDISKNLEIGTQTNYTNASNQRGFTNNANNDASVSYALPYLPSYANLFPVNGVYPDNEYAGENPLAIRDRAVNDEKTNRFIQTGTLNYYLLRKELTTLRLNVQGGVDYTLTEQELYLPDDLQSQRANANPGASRFSKNRQLNTNLNTILVLNHQVGKVGLTSQAGFVRLSQNFDGSFTQGEGLIPGTRNPALAKIQTLGQAFTRVTDIGYFAQQEANFDDKVIAALGIRADKSTLNSDENKMYFFPKASLALNIAKFDFWTIDKVSQFKVRAAYGETGGAAGFGDYFSRLLSVSVDNRLGLRNSTLIGYDKVAPERATELEAGVDLGFLNNRITLEATVYRKNVKDLILTRPLAPSTGAASVTGFPIGDMVNKGIELGLAVTAIDRPNFRYNNRTQFWLNRTEVTKLDVATQIVGPGFGNFFGRNQLKLNESPTRWFGAPLVNGQLTPYQESQPKFQMTFANNFTIMKNIDFSFLIHVKEGGYNSTLTQLLYDEGGTTKDYSNDPQTAADGSLTTLGERRYNQETAGFIQNASYMKLREVSLYYTFQKAALGETFGRALERVKVGVSGNNLFLITPYKGGYDPEVSAFGSRPVGGNIDLAAFPSARRMFFHLALDF
ncbi:SusC/RagA family TonB-linked outer membrane protein [Hymenobacter glacialis]|uniref:SusC/RagA family TonB-linked outer membrane protein n=1 Tax=Hymenobacter glacialis TaxID=1908236 RepID=A0A1G1SUS4_9BACT|nr:SusC/RagA family TonB-linked outer membrane protein [Hymenobacter glacialis]OGX82373.1 hypothetical protein BEN48_05360 [Hymenobacter glacialis]